MQTQEPRFFIQGDGWLVHRSDKTKFIPTFDLLFKMYYVLNLEYPVILQNFFQFIQRFLYKITTDTAVVSSVTTLHVSLSSIKDKQLIDCNALIDDSDNDSESESE